MAAAMPVSWSGFAAQFAVPPSGASPAGACAGAAGAATVRAMDEGVYILAGLMLGVIGFLWTIHRDMRNLSERAAEHTKDLSERLAGDMRNLSERAAKDNKDLSERLARDMRELSERTAKDMSELSARVSTDLRGLSDRVARLEGLLEGSIRRREPAPEAGE